MSDLRASGEIEQDADYILLLHREDYYDENTHMQGVVELIVGKARHSRARSIFMKNRMDQMRVEDWVGPLPQKPAQEERPKRQPRGFPKHKDYVPQ
jgi:replicative DNA helicase